MDSRLGLPPNTIIDGSYRITRVVGVGGFGVTYEAEDTNLSTRVAIKEYYPFDFGDRDSTMSVKPKSDRHKKTFEWGRANFLQEARTLARFEHPSIVRVTRVFEANSTAYMVMRYEQGLSFENWLVRLNRLPTQEELDAIVAPVLDALEMLHSADFLHRDIAPDNIIVRADGSPVLLDFGAARRAVAEMSRTLTGIVKAGYSPHEQYSSNNRLQGPWSDFYALGGTLYRAVTGRPPEEATLRVSDDRMPPAAQAVRKGRYRPGFLQAIDACLKVKHADRPRSVAQLRPMILGTQTQSRPGLDRLAEVFKSPTKPPSRPTHSIRTRRTGPPEEATARRSWLGIAAAILVVLGGAAGGYGYINWTADDPEAGRKAELDSQRRADAEDARRRLEAQMAERKAQEERVRREADAAAAKKVEEERVATEKRAADERARVAAAAAAKKSEEERVATEKRATDERARVAAAAAAKKSEEDRIAAEKRAADERARVAAAAAAKKAEEDRIAAEKRAADERARREAERQKTEDEARVAARPDAPSSSDVVTPGQDGAVTMLATDGQWFATGTEKGTVQLWQLAEGAPAKRIGSSALRVGRITAIAFGQDDAGKVAASDKDGAIAFWDVQSNRVQAASAPGQPKAGQPKTGPAKRVVALRYSAADKQFMALSVVQAKGAYQTAIERWRPDGRAVGEPKPIKTGTRPPQAGAFAPNDDLFAVVTNGELQVFNSGGDAPVITEPFTGYARTLAFSPDGRRIAIAGQFDQIRIWDVEEAKRLARPLDLDLTRLSNRLGADVAAVTALAFSPDGRFLAAANADNKIAVWDLQAPAKPLAEYEGSPLAPTEPIMWLSLLQPTPGKTVLMLPGNDGTTRRISVGAGG